MRTIMKLLYKHYVSWMIVWGCILSLVMEFLTRLPKVIWEEGRVAAKVSHSRFDNDGKSGRRKTESLLRRSSLHRHYGLSPDM